MFQVPCYNRLSYMYLWYIRLCYDIWQFSYIKSIFNLYYFKITMGLLRYNLWEIEEHVCIYEMKRQRQKRGDKKFISMKEIIHTSKIYRCSCRLLFLRGFMIFKLQMTLKKSLMAEFPLLVRLVFKKLYYTHVWKCHSKTQYSVL